MNFSRALRRELSATAHSARWRQAGVAREAGRKQPDRTEPAVITTPAPAPPRGDEAGLYGRHHRNLQRAVALAINARAN